ncbi:Nonribosomal peptide synthetase 13 [Aspergillus aurantiobrunneus]
MNGTQATDPASPVRAEEPCSVPSPIKSCRWMECTVDFSALGLTPKDVSPALLLLCAAASHGDLRNYTGCGVIGIDANAQLSPIREEDDLVDCLVPIEPDFDLGLSVSETLDILGHDLQEEAQRHDQYRNVMSRAAIRHIVILEENEAIGKSPKWMQQLKAAGQTDGVVPTTILHCILEQGSLSLRIYIRHPGVDGACQTQSVVDNFLYLLAESPSHPKSRLVDTLERFLPMSPTASIPDVPPPWEVCVHQVIQDQCRKSPDSLAVDAWDGSLTYRQLDELSDGLARALMLLGIGPERFVPICMEKSQWTSVAILAVIKSGGAFSLLDPAHPVSRLQMICDDLQCPFILASEAQATRCLELADVLVVEHLSQACRSSRVPQEMPLAQPGNALYVAFTSGSTGKPKGVVIEHQAYCSSAQSHTQAFQINHRSRVLQFAAYAFDVSILETLSTLMAGACLCIPSEAQRNDMVLFEDALKTFRLTHVGLPPSFARIVPWTNFKERPTLMVGGEPMRKSDRTIYSALGMRLMNAYGPTECSVNATIHHRVRPRHPVQNIGKPTGAVAWIVDPDDMEKPMEWDSVGELLLEGPIVGRGYLDNYEATRKAFIDPPAWLRRLRKGQSQHRVYRTGDLASQDQTGAIQIIGRKDGQFKIRGQRVEVADVEHHVNDFVATSTEVVVEKVVTSDEQQRLIAFIVLDGPLPAQPTDSLFLAPNASDMESFKGIQEQLHSRLPRYMVPDLWIPLVRLPKAASGKIDRRLLRDTAAAMSQKDLYAFACSTTEKRAPTTSTERTLQQVYADILQVEPTTIGMDDIFLRLGGDSVQAIRLVGAARKAGLTIQMQEVLGEVSLADQADKAMALTPLPEAIYTPFSLLEDSVQADVLRLAQEQCSVQQSQIQDIYPCTPLQEGMFATSLQRPGMYTGNIVFRIPLGVDTSKFKQAWKATANNNPILRTRIIQTSHGFFQVVVDTFSWREHTDATQKATGFTTLVGEPLMQCVYKQQERELVLTAHHAVSDDWTLRLIQNQVEAAYQGHLLEKQHFHPFIQYTRGLQGVEEFWATQLSGLDAAVFPELPASNYRPAAAQTVQHKIEGLCLDKQTPHTLPTYIYLAWAMLVAHYTDSPDVVYGATLSGRNAPVPAIESMVGPTITTLPLRIQLQSVSSVVAALDQVQRTLTSMIPYEQAGMSRIAKSGQDGTRACQFQSQLIIQSPEETNHASLLEVIQGSAHTGLDYTTFCEFAMMLSVLPSADRTSMTIDTAFDANVVSPDAMRRILCQFTHILRQIMQQPTQQIEAVDMASPDDLVQLQRWNSEIPEADSRCLQDLVLTRCHDQPQATAICAWDGSLTYADLAGLSSSLAYRLRLLDVHPGSSVGICLERSKWSVVAILAVLRAGGTCILLDLNHPRQRIHDILKETSVQVLINSETTAALTSDLTPVEVRLAPAITDILPQTPFLPDTPVSPTAPAFILFTSGSTGRPKGIVMPHSTFASSIRYHSAPMNVGVDSRVLHFSSYAFDVSIYEIFTTLAAGATICVPSEFERKNALAEAICRFQVNWAFLTPSTVQTLQPSEVSCLSTLVLGGEAVTRDNVDVWATGRTLVNGYGPAEATICGVGTIPPTGWKQGLIGSIVGGVGWVTMPTDPSRLAAIGAIGELLLEGPFLAAGYFNLPDATAASFIESPAWRQKMSLGPSSGLYRTGDLVQYQDDGTIRYMGRQGTRMKLHGQLIDLGEVETNTLREFPAAKGVAAEILPLDVGGNTAATLVVYIQSDSNDTKERDPNAILDSVCQEFRHSTTEAQTRLRGLLPSYMVPSMFIPVQVMPRTMTGKLDRRTLRSAVQSLSPEQLQHYRAAPRAKTPVSSDAERLLQAMWADLLGIAKESIGAEDNFLAIGGDSILTMRMVATARRAGFAFTVADVLNPNTSLSSLALASQAVGSGQEDPVLSPSQPSILTSADFKQHLSSLQQRGILPLAGNVTSARPATEAQSTLISRYPWFNFQFPYQGKINEDRLRDACRALVRAHDVLRVVFVEYHNELFQLTLAEDIDLPLQVVTTDNDLDTFCESLCHSEQAVSVPSAGVATRFTLVSDPTHTRQRLIIRLAHAQYDANSTAILFHNLEAAYDGQKIAGTSFDRYLEQRARHSDQEQHRAFWQEYLGGSSLASTPLDLTSPAQLVTGTCDLALPDGLPPSITLPTVVKAAAGLVLARHLHRPDIVVGQTVDGRSLPFPDIDRVVGACINYIPFRVQPRASMTARDYLLHAQAQHARSLGSESVDLRTIASHCTNWSSPTEFGYIVQHQTANHGLTLTLGNQPASLSLVGGLTPGSEVWICSTDTPSGVRIDIHCSAQRMSLDRATSMASEVCAMINDLLARLDRSLYAIEGITFLS